MAFFRFYVRHSRSARRRAARDKRNDPTVGDLRGFLKPIPGSGRVPLYKTAEVTSWLESSKEAQQ